MHEAEDEPLFAERAAGTDIAKAGIEVTVRVPSETRRGGRQQDTPLSISVSSGYSPGCGSSRCTVIPTPSSASFGTCCGSAAF
jgi:hypothetical protein